MTGVQTCALPICFDSDTGELSLDYGKGLFTIRTPRTQAAIGYLAEAGPVDLGEVRVECQTEFAVVSATSMDGKAIGESRRILLTAVGRAENTGQAYWPPEPGQLEKNRMSWMLPAEGRSPVIVEPIRATVMLPLIGKAAAYRLDPTGKRGDRLGSSTEGGRLRVDLSGARTKIGRANV